MEAQRHLGGGRAAHGGGWYNVRGLARRLLLRMYKYIHYIYRYTISWGRHMHMQDVRNRKVISKWGGEGRHQASSRSTSRWNRCQSIFPGSFSSSSDAMSTGVVGMGLSSSRIHGCQSDLSRLGGRWWWIEDLCERDGRGMVCTDSGRSRRGRLRKERSEGELEKDRNDSCLGVRGGGVSTRSMKNDFASGDGAKGSIVWKSRSS